MFEKLGPREPSLTTCSWTPRTLRCDGYPVYRGEPLAARCSERPQEPAQPPGASESEGPPPWGARASSERQRRLRPPEPPRASGGAERGGGVIHRAVLRVSRGTQRAGILQGRSNCQAHPERSQGECKDANDESYSSYHFGYRHRQRLDLLSALGKYVAPDGVARPYIGGMGGLPYLVTYDSNLIVSGSKGRICGLALKGNGTQHEKPRHGLALPSLYLTAVRNTQRAGSGVLAGDPV